MRSTLSIKRTVLSGRVSANCSARFTMRRASRVVASQADKKANSVPADLQSAGAELGEKMMYFCLD